MIEDNNTSSDFWDRREKTIMYAVIASLSSTTVLFAIYFYGFTSKSTFSNPTPDIIHIIFSIMTAVTMFVFPVIVYIVHSRYVDKKRLSQ